MVVEENFTDGVWSQLMSPIMRRLAPGCGMEEIKSKGQKELRLIEQLGPVTAQHRLVINRQALEQDSETAKKYLVDSSDGDGALEYQFSYQYAHLTSDRNCLKHDDRLEAVAMAAQYFTDMLHKDRDLARRDRQEEEYEQMMEEWLEWVEDKPRHQGAWIDE